MICEYTEILNELKRKIAELVSREPSAGRLYYLMGIKTLKNRRFAKMSTRKSTSWEACCRR